LVFHRGRTASDVAAPPRAKNTHFRCGSSASIEAAGFTVTKSNLNPRGLIVILPTQISALKDTANHQGLRNKLVATLRQKGITDENVLNAITKVPRHLFLDSSFEEFAYQDKPFPIGAGQTISQPYTVAFQTQLLEVKKDAKILEIGTGSGYQTAVLFMMGAKVYSVERQSELFKKTSVFLPKMGIRPKHLSFGDGYKGLPPHA